MSLLGEDGNPAQLDLPARVIPFPENDKVGVYCPYCGNGKLRPMFAVALKAGRGEHCIGCVRHYRIPDLSELGLNVPHLRRLAAAATELADKLERGE